MKTLEKDPNARLDYSVQWAVWLAGDTIVQSDWVIPVGLKKGPSSFDTISTTIWLEGGTLGRTYTVTNRIRTAAGRIEDRSFALTIVDR